MEAQDESDLTSVSNVPENSEANENCHVHAVTNDPVDTEAQDIETNNEAENTSSSKTTNDLQVVVFKLKPMYWSMLSLSSLHNMLNLHLGMLIRLDFFSV